MNTHTRRFLPALLLAIAALTLTFQPLKAGDKPSDDASAKISACQTVAGEYAHGALSFFNTMLCMLNVQFPSIAEEMLYHLVVNMGLSPDVSALAASGATTALEAKTFRSKAVTGTVQKVVSPDTFAGTYDYHVAVSVDGVQHISLYWSGSGSTSKGFITMGRGGLGSGASHLQYIRWNRTSADAQSVEVLSTTIQSTSSYLGNVQPIGTGKHADRAIFGAMTYNASTKAVTVQMTTIGGRRGAQSASTTPGCYMMYATGTKDGSVVVAKTNNALGETGHAVASTTQDGIVEMDSASIVDSKTTANGTGNSSSAPGFAMHYDCAALDGADASGKPFNGDTVNFAMTLTQANAMFAAN